MTQSKESAKSANGVKSANVKSGDGAAAAGVKIAVTGGIGSGKSEVMALLKAQGYPVFSCDEIYRELCAEPAFLGGLEAAFPGCVEEGVLNRPALAARVFGDGEALRRLNDLTHPAIMERLFARMTGPLSFAEVPLLFERGYEKRFDGVIVVLREKSARVEALKARDGLTEEEIAARMARQFDYARLPAGCFPLRNDGTLGELNRALSEILAHFTNITK